MEYDVTFIEAKRRVFPTQKQTQSTSKKHPTQPASQRLGIWSGNEILV